MESLFLANLTSPPLLFFVLGALAVILKSDLEIPEPVAKLLSLYLLLAIGFKGGVALATNPLGGLGLKTLGSALALSAAIPCVLFVLLRKRLGAANAAGVAATYGSISAVTFVTATSYLDTAGISWSGYLVAAMALMESPAIIVGLMLYSRYRSPDTPSNFRFAELLREACLNGSVFLIVGSLVIGWLTGYKGKAELAPFTEHLFAGVLCLFLLDMGIVAMRRVQDLRTPARGGRTMGTLLGLGLTLPILQAVIGLAASRLLGLSEGDALLLVVLTASASYIAVPAALRIALPAANPSLYLGMSLAVTFPFNLLVGIPAYHAVVLALGP